MKYKKEFGSESTLIPDCERQQNPTESGGGRVESCGTNNFHHRHQQQQHGNSDNDPCGNSNQEDEQEQEEENDGDPDHETQTEYTLLSFSLWKDRLYEDWGFSLTDTEQDEPQENGASGGSNKTSNGKAQKSPSTSVNQQSGGGPLQGSEILQIRPGGPAYAAGLLPGDRIMQV